jgi:hypothetical protein
MYGRGGWSTSANSSTPKFIGCDIIRTTLARNCWMLKHCKCSAKQHTLEHDHLQDQLQRRRHPSQPSCSEQQYQLRQPSATTRTSCAQQAEAQTPLSAKLQRTAVPAAPQLHLNISSHASCAQHTLRGIIRANNPAATCQTCSMHADGFVPALSSCCVVRAEAHHTLGNAPESAIAQRVPPMLLPKL